VPRTEKTFLGELLLHEHRGSIRPHKDRVQERVLLSWTGVFRLALLNGGKKRTGRKHLPPKKKRVEVSWRVGLGRTDLLEEGTSGGEMLGPTHWKSTRMSGGEALSCLYRRSRAHQKRCFSLS